MQELDTNKNRQADMKCILCGGGDDIFRILDDLKSVLEGRSVGYVVVAAEPNPGLMELIQNGFVELTEHLKSLGAKDAVLVDSSNFQEMFQHDLVVLSGGDSEHLLEVLKNNSFKDRLRDSQVEVLIGISAGAIAIAHEGIGMRDGQEVLYKGLNLIDGQVVPHSTSEKKTRHPAAVHLDEYEWKELSFSFDV